MDFDIIYHLKICYAKLLYYTTIKLCDKLAVVSGDIIIVAFTLFISGVAYIWTYKPRTPESRQGFPEVVKEAM